MTGQLAALVDVVLADLARIRATVDAARVTLADADDQAESARIGMQALRDQLTGGDQS